MNCYEKHIQLFLYIQQNLAYSQHDSGKSPCLEFGNWVVRLDMTTVTILEFAVCSICGLDFSRPSLLSYRTFNFKQIKYA